MKKFGDADSCEVALMTLLYFSRTNGIGGVF
jgi:hypothetical protein